MRCFLCLLLVIFHFSFASAQFTIVELNCENLFDTRHDSLKQDQEFLPDGSLHWTKSKYWRKLNAIGQEILSCDDKCPELVALVEVENDSVLFDLTRRSLLRNAGYRYTMTASPDVRGLDVAILYQPERFTQLSYSAIRMPPLSGQRPTRDILYIKGVVGTGDTLHIFIVHAPSRYGGEKRTRPYRMQVARLLCQQIDSLGQQAQVIITGDFNDYAESPALQHLYKRGLVNVTASARGRHGAQGTYRYRGEWRSIDHLLVTPSLSNRVDSAYVNDAPFLLEEDDKYGGYRPRRTFRNYRYQPNGFSDHLPLVVRFRAK